MEEQLNIPPELTFTVSGKEITVNRPEPILTNLEVFPFDRKMDPRMAVDAWFDL